MCRIFLIQSIIDGHLGWFEMAKDLDSMVEDFRTRPLDSGPYYYHASAFPDFHRQRVAREVVVRAGI